MLLLQLKQWCDLRHHLHTCDPTFTVMILPYNPHYHVTRRATFTQVTLPLLLLSFAYSLHNNVTRRATIKHDLILLPLFWSFPYRLHNDVTLSTTISHVILLLLLWSSPFSLHKDVTWRATIRHVILPLQLTQWFDSTCHLKTCDPITTDVVLLLKSHVPKYHHFIYYVILTLFWWPFSLVMWSFPKTVIWS